MRKRGAIQWVARLMRGVARGVVARVLRGGGENEGWSVMRGFVSMALRVELVESNGGVVRHERGRGWLKKSAGMWWIDFDKTLRIAEGAFDRGGVGF